MNDFLQKIKRVIVCQRRHLMAKIRISIPHTWFLRFPRLYSCMVYASAFGKYPNLFRPAEVCELLMQLNIKAIKDKKQRRLRALCADKYAVRQYVKDKGLADILNEYYGVWDSFDEIDFNQLPNQFVLKTNFSCGQNLIIKDKSTLDIVATKAIFRSWMAQPNEELLEYGEWHYTEIQRKIFAEKYLTELGEDVSIIDYKFHCFNGRVYGVFVCYDRLPNSHTVNFDHYTPEWKLTDGIVPYYHQTRRYISEPTRLGDMKRIAQVLSEGLEYVRVDLYEIDGKIIFGEMTFTPAGNTMTYYEEWMRKDMAEFYYSTK